MGITQSTKYVVRFEGRAITNGATRGNAHRLRGKLGDRYDVWNRFTWRVSKEGT